MLLKDMIEISNPLKQRIEDEYKDPKTLTECEKRNVQNVSITRISRLSGNTHGKNAKLTEN